MGIAPLNSSATIATVRDAEAPGAGVHGARAGARRCRARADVTQAMPRAQEVDQPEHHADGGRAKADVPADSFRQ
jgi:hypothetical protein